MRKTYKEVLRQKTITDYSENYDNIHKGLTEKIKVFLSEGNFSCNLWTKGWDTDEICSMAQLLTKENITHHWDGVMNCFLCFKNPQDMEEFYEKLKEELNSSESEFESESELELF